MAIRVQGDPELAKFFADFRVKVEPSKIVATDWLATAFNRKRLGVRRRIVDLSCRHKAMTSNRTRQRCDRCQMMLYHGLDYEGFLRGVVRDDMVWREDPLRLLNESTDLAGNFVCDNLGNDY